MPGFTQGRGQRTIVNIEPIRAQGFLGLLMSESHDVDCFDRGVDTYMTAALHGFGDDGVVRLLGHG